MTATNGNGPRKPISAAQEKIESDQAAVTDPVLSFRGHCDVNLRLARLNMLKNAIASGTYGIPAEAVAEKMVNRMLREPEETGSPNARPVRRGSDEV